MFIPVNDDLLCIIERMQFSVGQNQLTIAFQRFQSTRKWISLFRLVFACCKSRYPRSIWKCSRSELFWTSRTAFITPTWPPSLASPNWTTNFWWWASFAHADPWLTRWRTSSWKYLMTSSLPFAMTSPQPCPICTTWASSTDSCGHAAVFSIQNGQSKWAAEFFAYGDEFPVRKCIIQASTICIIKSFIKLTV